MNIDPMILKALKAENYEIPTDIQAKAIPPILEGRDVLGCAQTGTGKTCAFAVPTLQRLSKNRTAPKGTIRALILTPTRELAVQIDESFDAYGRFMNLKSTVIYGGVAQRPQEDALRRGVDILVATPGRLLDLINQNIVKLGQVEICILDEADRMLDMGFINDVKKILAKTPKVKQTLLFSATMPQEISSMSDSILNNPVKIQVTPVSSTVEIIDQSVYYVDKANKKDLLIHLLDDKSIESALVFTRTKHGADKVVKELLKKNINALAIHGDKAQSTRQTALNKFKSREIRVLVATDIAARGIDVNELSHVFNYDLPEVPETYVHRIGRTGRAGQSGKSISFCDFAEQALLKDIEKLTKKKISAVTGHPFPMVILEIIPKATTPRRPQQGQLASRADNAPQGRSFDRNDRGFADKKSSDRSASRDMDMKHKKASNERNSRMKSAPKMRGNKI
jgi:ATP-dependent RNA helicase RhlE